MLLSKLYSIAFLQPGRADLNLESGTCLSSALKCGGGGAVCTPPPSLPTPARPPSASHPSLSHHPHKNSPPLDRRVFTSFPSYQQIKGSKAIYFFPQRNRTWNPSERVRVAGEGRGPDDNRWARPRAGSLFCSPWAAPPSPCPAGTYGAPLITRAQFWNPISPSSRHV